MARAEYQRGGRRGALALPSHLHHEELVAFITDDGELRVYGATDTELRAALSAEVAKALKDDRF
jgi:flagellar motor component MotA